MGENPRGPTGPWPSRPTRLPPWPTYQTTPNPNPTCPPRSPSPPPSRWIGIGPDPVAPDALRLPVAVHHRPRSPPASPPRPLSRRLPHRNHAVGLLELLLDPMPSPVVATTTSPACLLLLPGGCVAPPSSSSSIIATPSSGASPSSFLAQLQGPVSTFSPFPLCSVAVSPWLRARRVRARPC